MQNLLAKYLARPTVANALRVARYDRMHPFAALMLNHLESALCAECYALAASYQHEKA